MGCSSSSSCCLRRTASAQLYGGRAVPEVLRTERLRRVFGGLVAVNEMEFTAGGGGVGGLIRPKRGGKNTVFKLGRGALRGFRGRLFFQGPDVTHPPADR